MLAACTAGPVPQNRVNSAWMPEQVSHHDGVAVTTCSRTDPPGLDPAAALPVAMLPAGSDLIAPGDRVRLRIAGDDERLSGVLVVDDAGTIAIPGLAPIAAAGLTEAELARRVAATLVREQLVRRIDHGVDLRRIESVGVSVAVGGAVFDPGTVRVGDRSSEARVGQREGLASGDANPGRSLAAALRAAGGVRPDADIARVYLVRAGRWSVVDLGGIIDGTATGDVAVAAGDRVIVPSEGCFHAALARPTPVTQPGIRVFMSNLARSANNNAGAAIGKDSTSLPYGTRMLQAVAAMNCIGGSAMNASRRAVLISRNPINGQSIVVERAVERLVRDAGRDDQDPYLMPGDTLACYDSRAMNFADAIGLVSNAFGAVTPALLLRNGLR